MQNDEYGNFWNIKFSPNQKYSDWISRLNSLIYGYNTIAM